ncbi:MAG: hypothetical protein M1818_008397 [Claussenomyces sp. TS43310]|nr:MAG: hypothetical protein M1818_008397 [Claussenomyces sp. TS43310]
MDILKGSMEWEDTIFPGVAHSWPELQFLRDEWDGQIVVKGIQSAVDAELAVQAGVDGIIVSNHGGRQYDGGIGALDALQEVTLAVGNRTEVFFDSGVRSGADIMKALALGAKAVFVRRPVACGLAATGEAGAAHVMRCLLATTEPTLHPHALAATSNRGGSRQGQSSGASGQQPAEMAPLNRADGDDEVRAEKERGLMLAEELSKSLADLNALSNETTRQLDNSYYSILERLSSLRSTVASLKELATTMRALDDDFARGAQQLVGDVETQLDAFDAFREPQRRLQGLQARVAHGRDTIRVLGARVNAVHRRVERWEALEGRWQQKMRQRLRVMWGVMAAVILVLLGLWIFHYTAARTHGPAILKGFNGSRIGLNLSRLESELINDTLHLKRSATGALAALRPGPEREPADEDPRLRAFDEL